MKETQPSQTKQLPTKNGHSTLKNIWTRPETWDFFQKVPMLHTTLSNICNEEVEHKLDRRKQGKARDPDETRI